MHTAHLLPISPSMHCSWGGVPAWGCTCQGDVLARGDVPAQEVYLPGVCTSLGVYLAGGVPAQGLYLPRGCTCLGGGVPARCKSITLPQTLFAGGKNQPGTASTPLGIGIKEVQSTIKSTRHRLHTLTRSDKGETAHYEITMKCMSLLAFNIQFPSVPTMTLMKEGNTIHYEINQTQPPHHDSHG